MKKEDILRREEIIEELGKIRVAGYIAPLTELTKIKKEILDLPMEELRREKIVRIVDDAITKTQSKKEK